MYADADAHSGGVYDAPSPPPQVVVKVKERHADIVTLVTLRGFLDTVQDDESRLGAEVRIQWPCY